MMSGEQQKGRTQVTALHPSVAFYTEQRPVRLHLLPDEAIAYELDVTADTQGEGGEAHCEVYCFGLHTMLLPPCGVDPNAETRDNLYAEGIASGSGIELLRRHWVLLVALLLPTNVRRVSSSSGGDGGATASADALEPLGAITTAAECLDATGQLSAGEFKRLFSPGVMDKVEYSYIVFLRFYGWRLHDEQRGVLDRHRGWADRYAALEQGVKGLCWDGRSPVDMASPSYGTFNFYHSGLIQLVDFLKEFRLFRYAVGLVEFILEEIKSQRLTFLLEFVEVYLLPRVENCPGIDETHCTRLRKKHNSIVNSDSE